MCPDNDDTNPGSDLGAFFHAEEKVSSTAAPPPLPKRAHSVSSEMQNPLMSISSAGLHPFQEMPEPKLAPDASLEDRLYFFQLVAEQRGETLERARALYVNFQKEYQALRAKLAQVQMAGPSSQTSAEHAVQVRALQELLERETLRTQEAENRVVLLKGQISELEEERKDLARALAEVEGQYSQFKQSMEGELESHKQMEEELARTKEELVHTEEQVAELAAERADMAGQLEATTEGYESCVKEAEQFAEENENLRSEIEAYKSSFGQYQSSELHLMAAELKELKERVEASESEQKWLEQNLERSETRVQELEEAHALLEQAKVSEEAPSSEQKVLKTELENTRAEFERKCAELSASQRRELSVEQRAAQLLQDREALETRLQSLRREFEEARRYIQENMHSVQQSAGALNELGQLRETVVLLKKRLLVAEAAAEAAAGLKSKVARLESMLRQGGR
ncbi:MAG: hypothetical protein FWD46_08180 [Cystobacterineae bacterium]|nr:hypothetical protein [Cystobacterineae bacterium]